MKTNAFLFLICLVVSSCNPAANKLRRANRLIKKAETLGAIWRIDSVQVEVPVILKEIRVDSIFKDKPGDTVVLIKDRLKVMYVRLPGDSVFLDAESKQDTIYQTVTKTVEKVIYAPEKGLKTWQWIIIALAAGLIVGIIIKR